MEKCFGDTGDAPVSPFLSLKIEKLVRKKPHIFSQKVIFRARGYATIKTNRKRRD